MRLADRSSLNKAAQRVAPLGVCAGVAALLAGVALLSAPSGAAGAMASSFAAALGIVSAGFASAASMAGGRAAAFQAEQFEEAALPENSVQFAGRRSLWNRAGARVGWQQAALAGLCGVLAFGAACLAFRAPSAWSGMPAAAGVAAAASAVAAFAILVVERHLALLDPADLPEAPSLAVLLRVPLAVTVICGLGCLLLYAGVVIDGVPIGAYTGRVSAVLCLLISAEVTARAFATLFVPFPSLPNARTVAVSAVAGVLAFKRPRSVVHTMRDLFGIDLSRSWALAFMRVAFLPVVSVLLLFGWVLSGVHALHVDQRAIYERFGTPVAVLGPGLHLRLPWPLGRLRPLELGVVHDVPLVFAAAGPVPRPAPRVDAEGEPGLAADRLWDEAHPSEGSYLVASLSRGQQSFESVDVDLRVVYRIGLSDASAFQAAFAVSDPQRLVQAHGSRLLARYNAAHTLPAILGQDRASFSHDIQASLQAELDGLQSGLEVMAVVVEAIHPPPGAASAYRAVQSAQIGAHTAIAKQDAAAVETGINAKSDATEIGNAATAKAHEAVTDAQARATLFDADRMADAQNHDAFLLERRFNNLAAGLANRQVLIVDHRLGSLAAPILDMRPRDSGSIILPPAAEN